MLSLWAFYRRFIDPTSVFNSNILIWSILGEVQKVQFINWINKINQQQRSLRLFMLEIFI